MITHDKLYRALQQLDLCSGFLQEVVNLVSEYNHHAIEATSRDSLYIRLGDGWAEIEKMIDLVMEIEDLIQKHNNK